MNSMGPVVPRHHLGKNPQNYSQLLPEAVWWFKAQNVCIIWLHRCHEVVFFSLILSLNSSLHTASLKHGEDSGQYPPIHQVLSMVSVNSSGDGFGRLHFWGQVAALRATVPPCHRATVGSFIVADGAGSPPAWRCLWKEPDATMNRQMSASQIVWQSTRHFAFGKDSAFSCEVTQLIQFVFEKRGVHHADLQFTVLCCFSIKHRLDLSIRIADIADNICHELLSSTSCYIICNLFYITYMSVSFVLLCYLLFVMFCWYHFVGPFVLWVKYLNHVAIQAQSEAWLAWLAFSEVSG